MSSAVLETHMPSKVERAYSRRRRKLQPSFGPELVAEAIGERRISGLLLRLTRTEHEVLRQIAEDEKMTIIAVIRTILRRGLESES